MQVLGGSSFILNNSVPLAVTGLKTLFGNDEMMAGYKESFFSQLPGPAGLNMLHSGSKKIVGAVEDFSSGNVARGSQRLAAVAPVPMKQVLKLYLQNEMDTDNIGQKLSNNSGPNSTFSTKPGAAPAAMSEFDPATVQKVTQGGDQKSVAATAGTATGNSTPPTGRVAEPANASVSEDPTDLAGVPAAAPLQDDDNSLGKDVADAIKDLG